MCNLTLSDIMTSEVDCLAPDTSIQTVFQVLTKNNYSCCVIANENRVPLGIITERHLVQVVSENGASSEVMVAPVSDYMETPPFTLPEDSSLEDALGWVEKRNVRHLLVTATTGEILGIVTSSNLVQAYTRIMRHHSESLEQTVTQRTEELESVNRKLITLSMVDALTGLGNRRAMEVDIMRIHAAGIRHCRPYSIVLFDIDYFKKYNDHYGHQAGDNVLELVSNHFRKGVRDSDSVYRYGGEEFLMVMPDTNVEEAMIPVQRIVNGLADNKIAHTESPLEILTISAGIASSHHQGQRLASWRQVVEVADEGLYDAKNSGRNQVLVSQRSRLKAVN